MDTKVGLESLHLPLCKLFTAVMIVRSKRIKDIHQAAVREGAKAVAQKCEPSRLRHSSGQLERCALSRVADATAEALGSVVAAGEQDLTATQTAGTDLQESSDGASRLRLDIEKVLVSAGVQCTFEHTCMAAAAAAAAAASTISQGSGLEAGGSNQTRALIALSMDGGLNVNSKVVHSWVSQYGLQRLLLEPL
eukprot:1161584-Pelagomonas_calceolata.AAC.3